MQEISFITAGIMFHEPIFVLGTARSGTSLVSGILEKCGAWLGKTEPGGDKENPDGFFENRAIRLYVIKQIMLDHGCDPLGVRAIPSMKSLRAVDNLEQVIFNILKEEGYEGGPWAFKDAKLSLLWPIFLKVFPNAKWVIVRRDIDGIINSCLNAWFMKIHTKDPAYWRIWAELYVERANLLKQKSSNVYEIWPQEFVKGDMNSLREMIDWLGLDWNEEVSNFINKDYWHCANRKAA